MSATDLLSNEITAAVGRAERLLAAAPKESVDALDAAGAFDLDAGDRLSLMDMPTRMVAAGLVSIGGGVTLHRIMADWGTATRAQRMVAMQAVTEAAGKC